MKAHHLQRLGRFLLAVLLLAVATPAQAADSTAAAELQRTARAIARMPKASAAATLAGHVSQEGHWSFVNMSGETFTAASPEEIKRAIEVLLPGRESLPLSVFLTGDTLFERNARLVDLPKDAQLSLAWDEIAYRIVKPADTAARYLVEFRPTLLIEPTGAQTFAEALRQLARPLERQAFRILAVEPGGPRMLPSAPRIDRATGRADIDTIDPRHLAGTLGSLRGQTAVIVGRIEAGNLVVKPQSGAEQAIAWPELVSAAEAADVNLLVLKSSSAQQPGGRNWLWQKVEIKGLETALGHATMADFFDALGGPSNRLVLAVERTDASRTRFDVRQAVGLASAQTSAAQIGSVLSDVVSGLAGKVAHQGAFAEFRSARRDVELSRRLLPYIPSLAQWSYAAAIFLGLAGLPVAWRWWSRVWPAENPAEYGKAIGFWAARIIRTATFVLLFLPIVGIAAGPVAVWRWATGAKTAGAAPQRA